MDYYRTLEVSAGAGQSTIKRNYYLLARQVRLHGNCVYMNLETLWVAFAVCLLVCLLLLLDFVF
jgi:hypothetical protein